jgi:WD40 repeat protein
LVQPLITNLDRGFVDESSMFELTNGDLVCGTNEGDLMLWRMKRNGRFELLNTIPCHTRPIRCLEVLANGNVAGNFGDGTIQIWNLESDVMVQRLCVDTSVFKLLLLSNGHLASLLIDDSITVWNVANGRCVKTFKLHIMYRSLIIALPNEQFAAVEIASPENISVFNSNTGELAKSLIGHGYDVLSLVLLNDTHMASSSQDRTIKIWDLANDGRVVQTLPVSINNSDVDLALLRNGVLACFSLFSKDLSTPIDLWNWKTGELCKKIKINKDKEHVYFVKTLTKSPDNKMPLICLSRYASLVEVLNDV